MKEQCKELLILIVDDTPENLQVLGTILKSEGYRIMIAQNGNQALGATKKAIPDLILLDVKMPELGGFETCKRLKADPATREIPIIFLTAQVNTEDVVNGFELGAVDYVTKPFNATELLVRVGSHLGRVLLQRALAQHSAEIAQMRREYETLLNRELKSQILPILNCSGLLSQLGGDKLSDYERDWIDTIFENAGKMGKLIEALKQLQEFEVGRQQLKLSGLDFGLLVKRVCADQQAIIGNLVKIHFADELSTGFVEADEGLLSGVIQNLVRNGVEHTIEKETEIGRWVNIRLYNEKQHVVLEINNGGEPIPAQKLGSFFEKFNTGRTGQGMGLGTTYAYLVTKAHDGDISVTSNKAEGTTVRVRLPNFHSTVQSRNPRQSYEKIETYPFEESSEKLQTRQKKMAHHAG